MTHTPRRFLRYLASGVSAAAIVTAWTFTPVHAVESGGIGGRPAQPDSNNSRTQSIFVFNLDSGAKDSNAVKVYNNTSQEAQIEVYAVDSQGSSGGAFACAQKVDERRDVGSWIKLDKTTLTLPANSSEIIPFTLTVPSNASAGEHNGCIAIQQLDQAPEAIGNGLSLSFRSAIRVSVTVNGEIRKGLAITRLTGSVSDETIHINTAFRNTGNVSLDTTISARIKSIFGTTVRETGGEFPILANQESEFNFTTKDIFWGGIYVLSVDASYNADPSDGLGVSGEKTTISKSQVYYSAPQPLALAIELTTLALLVGGILFVILRKRTYAQWLAHGRDYTVKKDDNIQKIASMHGLSWRRVARVNKLRAPYALEPGQTLKLSPGIETHKKTPQRDTHKGKN